MSRVDDHDSNRLRLWNDQEGLFEDVHQTLQACIIFMFSPVLESGVDITIPMKKVYGVLSGLSNSQRAFMHMMACCKKAEAPMINVLNGQMVQINDNHNF